MPFFRFPFIYNPNFYNHFNSPISNIPKHEENKKQNDTKKIPHEEQYFFELFGLKLYYDDILLICLLLFLYKEGNKDEELFLSLILLLLS